MTTCTSVLGLLPMASGWSVSWGFPPAFHAGEAVELRAPLAIAVMGGLCSSTLLTLLSLPSVLLLTARLTGRKPEGGKDGAAERTAEGAESAEDSLSSPAGT
jgi:HAE1 family hydrophobic/amphiphilic exporter-1